MLPPPEAGFWLFLEFVSALFFDFFGFKIDIQELPSQTASSHGCRGYPLGSGWGPSAPLVFRKSLLPRHDKNEDTHGSLSDVNLPILLSNLAKQRAFPPPTPSTWHIRPFEEGQQRQGLSPVARGAGRPGEAADRHQGVRLQPARWYEGCGVQGVLRGLRPRGQGCTETISQRREYFWNLPCIFFPRSPAQQSVMIKFCGICRHLVLEILTSFCSMGIKSKFFFPQLNPSLGLGRTFPPEHVRRRK